MAFPIDAHIEDEVYPMVQWLNGGHPPTIQPVESEAAG